MRDRAKVSQFTTSLSLYAQKISSSGRQLCSRGEATTESQILTCAGVGIVAVAGAAVLGVAGVEAAEV